MLIYDDNVEKVKRTVKKVLVSTCCSANSYGSILQAYALKKALKLLGCESSIVMAFNSTVKKNIAHRIDIIHRIKLLFSKIYYVLFVKDPSKRKEDGNNDFIEKHLDVIRYNSYGELKDNPPQAELYISGSDQVWHPDLCNKTYFLDYVQPGEKRYSYAASMGKTKISTDKEKEFSRLISMFDSISVREKDMIEIVSKYTNKNIQQHIDPTFLIDREEWKKMEVPYSGLDIPYILVFAIYWDKQYNNDLREIHKKTGFNIVTIQSGYNNIYSNKRIYDADIGQFLWLIDNAEATISTSFHGVAMSIIFNKKCIPIINPSMPSRIDNLLDTLGYPRLSLEDIYDDSSIDYSAINRAILKERERSMAYLKEIVDNE